jgi:hypothetical protein
MARRLNAYNNFEELEQTNLRRARESTPLERIKLFHQLVRAWLKFPQLIKKPDPPYMIKRSK